MADEMTFDDYFDAEQYAIAYENKTGEALVGDAEESYLANAVELDLNPSNLFDESDFFSNALDKFAELWPEDGWGDVTVQMLRDWIVENTPNETALTYYLVNPDAYESLGLEPVEVTGDEVIVVPEPPSFTFTQDVTSVDEGASVTYTVTASSAVDADTTFSYELSSTEAGPADFASATAGTVTIAAGETTGTFTVAIASGDGAEFNEDFTVTLTDSSDTVVGALDNTIKDTSTADETAPTIDADQNLNYDENQEADAVLATVAAEDNDGGTGIASFAITEGDDDGYFAINADGEITLTEDGLTAASNDFETDPNTFDLMVTATDAAGNVSDAVAVTLEVDNVDDDAPELQSTVISGTTATLTFDEALSEEAAPSPSDFTVTLAGASGNVSVLSVSVDGASVELLLGRAPAAGETFQLAYTPGLNPIQDVAGNPAAGFSAEELLEDVTAPVITADQTFTYQEGAYDDVTDIVGTVEATDDSGSVATFAIESGNTSGFFAIDNSGQITLTTAGLEASAASQDFETAPNAFTLGIMATDGAGNTSSENVTVTITNDTADDADQDLELAFQVNTDTQEGGSGDDTFTGDDNTVDPGDVIDGNEGTDTARLFFSAAAATSESFTSREVEVIETQAIFNTALANGKTVSAQNFTGVQELWTNNSSTNLTYNNVGFLPTVGIRGGSGSVAAGGNGESFRVDFSSGVATGTLNVELEGANIANFEIDEGFTGIHFNTSIAGSTIVGIADTTGAIGAGGTLNSLTSVTVEGDQRLSIVNELQGVTTFNAQDSSGGLQVVIDDTLNVMFTGGSGNDRVDVQNAGLTVNDVLAGGTGTDTFVIDDGNMMTLANAGGVSGFEIFQTGNTAAAEVYNIDNIIAKNSLTGVTLGNTANATVNNINDGALGAINVAASANTNTLTAKNFVAGANNDTATINYGSSVTAGNIFNSTLDFASLDILNLTSNQRSTAAVNHTVNALATSDLQNAYITGNAALAVITAANTNPQGVDASGLVITNGATGLQWDQRNDAAGGGVLIKGTNVNDVLIGNSNGATSGDTLYGGQGSDILAVDMGATVQRDTFNYTATALGSGDMTAGDVDSIYGFDEDAAGVGATGALLDAGDDVINFTGSVEALLKSGGVVLSNAAAPVNLSANGGLGNTTNITAVDTGNDIQIQIDINGDGVYVQGSDFAINLMGAGLGGDEVVYYDAANDLFYIDEGAAGTVNDSAALGLTLTGSAGADTITGTAGADTLNGGLGADTLIGGDGSDALNGGGNASVADDDVFVITGTAAVASDTVNVDTIADFYAGAGSIAGSAAAAVDEIQFGSAFLGGNSNYTTANVVVSTATSAGFTSANANDIYVVSDGTVMVESGIAALASGASNGFSVATSEACVFIADDAAGNANIWYVNDSLDGTAADVTTDDVVLIGVLTGVNAAALVAGDFAAATV